MENQKWKMEGLKDHFLWIFSRTQGKFFMQELSPMPLRKLLSPLPLKSFLWHPPESRGTLCDIEYRTRDEWKLRAGKIRNSGARKTMLLAVHSRCTSCTS